MKVFRTALVVAPILIFAAAIGAIQSAPAQKTRATDFLIYATVFNDKGFTVAGAKIRARRVNESKWRWETASDGEGEFALHIPGNDVYVLRVDAKGYQTLSQDVDATQTDRADLALHLVPVGGGK